MPKSLSEVMKESEEMFEKLLEEPFQNGKPIFVWPNGNTNWDAVKSLLRSSQESIVEWVKEWAEERLKRKDYGPLGEIATLEDLLQELNIKE